MDLEGQYKEETNKRPTKVQDDLAYYTGDYVKWLEDKVENLILFGVGSTFTEKEKETLILLLHSEIQNTNEICFNNLDTQEYIKHHSKLIEKIEKQP